MKYYAFLTVICAASVALTTFASANPVNSFIHGSQSVLEKENAMETENQSPRDVLTDLIDAILKLTVGELLNSVDETLARLSVLISNGVDRLKQIMSAVDPTIRRKIDDIINNALIEAIDIITPLLSQLGLVLPQITDNKDNKMYRPTQDAMDAADLIQALLGMSLEEFLIQIMRVLEACDELIVRTITDLADISNSIADPTVAKDVVETSDTYLNTGRFIISPILDMLYKVLPNKSSL